MSPSSPMSNETAGDTNDDEGDCTMDTVGL
jgi:hypothetical protein